MFHLSRVWCMLHQSRLNLVYITYYEASHYTRFFGLLYSSIIQSKLFSKDSKPLFLVESERGSCTSMKDLSFRSLSYYRSTASSKKSSP
jgi:hypothetical protein